MKKINLTIENGQPVIAEIKPVEIGRKTMKDILEGNNRFCPNEHITKPIAEQIVKVLSEEKISYAQACEALDIAKIGIGNLIVSDKEQIQPRKGERVSIKG